MLGASADWMLVFFGGRARFAPMAMAKRLAAAGKSGVVVVCHFPNIGHTTAVHPSWRSFSLDVVGHRSLRCNRAMRGVPVFLPAPEGMLRVECDSISPRLGVNFELAHAEVALVEVVPADAMSPRSGELLLTIVNAAGERSDKRRGVYAATGVAPSTPEEPNAPEWY